MNSKVTHINVGNLAENCWFLANEDTKEAVVIDPGAEPDRICAAAEKHGWKITAILLTHGHIDHMGACESLRTELGVKVYALTEEEDLQTVFMKRFRRRRICLSLLNAKL